MVISRVSPATSISSPRRQSHVQSVVAEATHPVVLEQPVERGPVVELEADQQVGPQVGTVGVGTAGLMSRQAESGPHVGRRRLFISREAIQRLETTDVAVASVEEADLAGGAGSEAGGMNHTTGSSGSPAPAWPRARAGSGVGPRHSHAPTYPSAATMSRARTPTISRGCRRPVRATVKNAAAMKTLSAVGSRTAPARDSPNRRASIPSKKSDAAAAPTSASCHSGC